MIFAETERLFLRALSHDELPRLTALLDEWEVVRWMSVVPFPYSLRDAQDFYADMSAHYGGNEPQFYALAQKSNNILIGGVGLHPPRHTDTAEGEMEIGYWLGRDYWGRGFISEAVHKVLTIGFARPATSQICATTALNNLPSQKVLHKAGLRNIGAVPRAYPALRGENTVMRWVLTRDEYQTCLSPAQSTAI